MPVDFTRRPNISGRRRTAFKIIMVLMIGMLIYSIFRAITTGYWIGIIFPSIIIAFWYIIMPGLFTDGYQWFMIKVGLAKKMRPREWQDDFK